MKEITLSDDETNILRIEILETLKPIEFMFDTMLKIHPRKTRAVFGPFIDLMMWGIGGYRDLNTLVLLVEHLHEHADKQNVIGIREMMFFTIDRLRRLIRKEDNSTKRFTFEDAKLAKQIRR